MNYNKHERETVISIELRGDNQCQIDYNMGEEYAGIGNSGIPYIAKRLKTLGIIPESRTSGLTIYKVPKKWIKILRSRSTRPLKKDAWIMTRMPSVQNKMKRWKVEVYNKQGGYLVYNVPKSCIKIRKPQILSPAQQEHLKIIQKQRLASRSEHIK